MDIHGDASTLFFSALKQLLCCHHTDQLGGHLVDRNRQTIEFIAHLVRCRWRHKLASGDAGGALGAALFARRDLEQPRETRSGMEDKALSNSSALF